MSVLGGVAVGLSDEGLGWTGVDFGNSDRYDLFTFGSADETGTRRSTSPNYPWRYTYASIGLTSGLDIGFLAKQLGHSLTVFQTTYAKWLDREEDRAKLDRYYNWTKVGQIDEYHLETRIERPET